MIELHIIAHLVNAISLETCEIEFEVASQTDDGRWLNNAGDELYPIAVSTQMTEPPPIPEGWIEYLHTQAAKQAVKRSTNLLQELGLVFATAPKPAQVKPMVRRI